MQLYELLEREAGNSSSLAYVAKLQLRKSYEYEIVNNRDQELQNRIIEAVRDEIQQTGVKIMDSLLSLMKGLGGMSVLSVTDTGNILPEESEELPNGALDFLE